MRSRQRVLAIVAEQTGYPPDLLDMDLDLEADLGIDTVKQAEVFAAIREAYGIERDDSLKLRDYPTLNHVVGFVDDRTGSRRSAEPSPRPATRCGPGRPGARTAGDADGLPAPRPGRGPAPAARPLRRRPASSSARAAASSSCPTRGGVGDGAGQAARQARRRGPRDRRRARRRGARGQHRRWTAAGPIQGVYWLPALDDEGPLAALDPAELARGAARAREAAGRRDARARRRRRRPAPSSSRPPASAAATATTPQARPRCMGGAVTGFTKALARERPDALVKAVDFAPSRKTAALADLLVDETLRDPGAVEVGHADDLRWTVGLAERPQADPDPSER